MEALATDTWGRSHHGRAAGGECHQQDIDAQRIKTKNVATSVSGHSVIVSGCRFR